MELTDVESPGWNTDVPERWGAIIDGEVVMPPGAPTFAVTNPATGIQIAQVIAGDGELVDRAVRSSRTAFESDWRYRPVRERAKMMRAIAEKIRLHADELIELETLEVGKPLHISASDVQGSHSRFDLFADYASSLHGDILDHGAIESYTVYEPYGVVAAILPFNWPPIHFARKCAPALIGGNTVVMKPGEQAPLTALRLAEIANEVLPPGVLNAVPGIDAGPALVAHKIVGRITFTGSSATGIRVLTAAAENVTYATLELGGKNALIIRADADLDTALEVAIEGMFYNQGQACSSTSRILVQDEIFDVFLERFSRATERLVVGDGRDAQTEIGPMVDARQRDRVMGFLATAQREGARIYAQGTIPSDDRLRNGCWVAPTVLVDVAPDSTAGQEEIFGPIASVMRFTTDDEAIEIANGTRYGLTAAICSRDVGIARAMAARLEAGVVRINNYQRGSIGAPSGGVKASGLGRDGSIDTMWDFVQSKSIQVPSGRGEKQVWAPARQQR
jgi:acyl-CoA reductase-like NAD-dependent aldehyde dehydrogenase